MSKLRLPASGDRIVIATTLPGRPPREAVVLERLLQEGQLGGRERWLARGEGGEAFLVLVDPSQQETTT